MLTLFLVRHAKSEWANDYLKDVDRPLNERGYRDAQQMSESLLSKKFLPELIITSPAIRATSTALIFSRTLRYGPVGIRFEEKLYESSVKEYIDVVSNLDASKTSVMLFGHNPTITGLSNSLTSPFADNIPTCGVVGIRFKTKQWMDVPSTTGELFLYDFPKNR